MRSDHPSPGSLDLGGRYEIDTEIGSGTSGRVYRARQQSTGQSVAIKVLRVGEEGQVDLEQVERFRREMRICAELSHPHIVHLLDTGETASGELYAVFEHVPGETLADRIAREGALSPREAIRLMRQVLEALAYAHEHRIVHRDLKPANIMVSGTGTRLNAHVLDFGLGGLAEDAQRDEWRKLTRSKHFMGTPFYAAPEQLAGEPASPRSDLYASGLILLECLLGMHPCDQPGCAPPWAPGGARIVVPEQVAKGRLRTLIELLLESDPAARDIDVESVLDELEHLELDPSGSVTRTAGGADEWRPVSLISCRLVLRAAEPEALALEDRDAMLRELSDVCAELAARAGGRVASRIGDRVLLMFGYPRASEHDAARAASVAIGLVEALAERAEAQPGVRLDVHVGVHTGPVIVRGGRTGELEPAGSTPAIAADLDARAGPGEVLASDDVRCLLPSTLHADSIPGASIGGSSPTRMFRLTRSDTSAEAHAEHLTPLVGRHNEIERILEAWRAVEAGDSQALLIRGDAGIGKSRVLSELHAHIQPGRWLQCRCLPESRDAPLQPVIELLSASRESAAELLRSTGLLVDPNPALLDRLLSRKGEEAVELALSIERARELTLELLVSLLVRMADGETVVMAIEDLHWADPTTLELITRVVQELSAALASSPDGAPRLLLLLTARPEFASPPGIELPVLELPRLTRDEVERMIAAGLDVRTSHDVVRKIVSRSDGIPLFVEEVTRVLVERGLAADLKKSRESELTPIQIPRSLSGLLTARLDSVSPEAHATAQLASVLGREFRFDVLLAVSANSTAMLRRDLGELSRAGLVFPRGSDRFVFKHALVRDAAYASMLRSTRERRHRQVADVLMGELAEIATHRPEYVAQHLGEAGSPAEAASWRKRAGDHAAGRGAYVEAIRQYEAGLAQLEQVDPSPASRHLELELTEALGTALFSTRGYAVPEVQRTFARARELCEELGEEVSLRVLWGTWAAQIVQSDREATAALAETFMARAERSSDPVTLLLAHAAVATRALYEGDFKRALELVDRALQWYSTGEFQAHVAEYGYDVGMYGFATSMVCRFILGDADGAVRVRDQMMMLAEKSGNPYSLAIALGYGMNFSRERRDFQSVIEIADRQIEHATEQRLYYWLGPALCTRGWARARLGAADGIGEIQQGLALCHQVGLKSTLHYLIAGMADAELHVGDASAGLAAIDEGLELCRNLLDCFHESELLRLRGELLCRRGDRAEAREPLERSLSMARDRSARLYELRSATSLARWLSDRGERAEARALLEPLCDTFRGGRDIFDFAEADTLLRKLD